MEAGYGTWKSPISSRMTTQSGVDLNMLVVDSDPKFSDTVYWSEIRFDESGRYVICSSDKSGKISEWTPKDFNARTTVHEYGGGDFFVQQGVVYFSNFSDQALYKQTSPAAAPEPVTDPKLNFRFADGRFCPQKKRIYSVQENHDILMQNAKEPMNSIVSINPATQAKKLIAKGADFYACPRVSSDGTKIAWVQWKHPNMPFDSTEIWTADLSPSGDEIVQGSAKKVVGGKDTSGQDFSVILPSWTDDGQLLYIGDETDWWNLYLVNHSGEHVNLHEVNKEIGGPQWRFGTTAYALEPNGGSRIITTFGGELGILDMKSKSYKKIETGFTSHVSVAWTGAGSLCCKAYSETKFTQILRVDIETGEVAVVRVSMTPPVDSAYFSICQKISWPTTRDEICHGHYYPPTNKDYKAPAGELPPLLVRAHGGPTSAFSTQLNLKLQYFTSRGFAVLCVDYRGSVGYGKKYRHRLRGMWGVLDIEDCSMGVKYLVSNHMADPNRICIDGVSAGGYTTLACLTFTDTFQVGVSHYGISDLLTLYEETHKFESRYLDTLLAPIMEGGRELCDERSPIKHLDKLKSATGFFQGDEDKVVPPSQAQTMYEAVKAKGLPAMFVLFKGEQHGFRKSENIEASLDGEFYFFGKVLGFEPADKGIEFPIDNL